MDDANQMSVKAQFFAKDAYGAALAALSHGARDASIEALYAVQVFLDTMMFPKSALRGAGRWGRWGLLTRT